MNASDSVTFSSAFSPQGCQMATRRRGVRAMGQHLAAINPTVPGVRDIA